MTLVGVRSLVTQPNLANARWYPPHLLAHMIPSGATGGVATLIHCTGQAGGEPPLHIHSREDEFYYILEGEAVFHAGGQQLRVRPGHFVWLPRQVAHGFTFYSTVGKGLLGFTPGNYENWLLEFSRPADFLNLPPDPNMVYEFDLPVMLARGEELGVEFLDPEQTVTMPNPDAPSQPFIRHVSDCDEQASDRGGKRLLASVSETAGALCLFQSTLDAGRGTAVLRQAWPEVIYVLDGQLRLLINDVLVEIGPDASVFVPSGAAFGLRNEGDSNATYLEFHLGGPSEGCELLESELRQ